MLSKRELVKTIVKKRVRALDIVNANADFSNFVVAHAGGAPRFDYREDVYEYAASQLRPDTPVDFLEFGVWRGESLDRWSTLLPGKEHRFFGFDSFRGLPEDWRHGAGDGTFTPRGTFDEGGVAPTFADDRIQIVDGLFQDTLTAFLNSYDRRGRQLVVHMDADLYSSTLFVLTTLDRVLRSGDMVVSDDFATLLDEFRAFSDYFAAYRRQFRVLATVPRVDKIALQLGDRQP
jgi:hypothetical protein